MDKQDEESFKDLAKGCLVGALSGDAIGSFVEFKTEVSKEEADLALTIPGGGPFNLGKGQITDDGELSLCLAHGLVHGKGSLNLDIIGFWYAEWVKSRPFDMGTTTRNALSECAKVDKNFARACRKGSQRSSDSQSNGALMRITPLCIWGSELRKEQLITAVTEETKLTHPNQTIVEVSIAYAYTIQYLLKNKGDYKGAFLSCKEIIKELGNEELMIWIDELESGELPTARWQIGWVKHAFIYALYYLKNNFSYFDAMKHMLLKGGDTDTNCCIVGGMLGALHGFKKLPSDITKKVLEYNSESDESGISRPEFLNPSKHIDQIIIDLIKYKPSSLEIIGEETKEEKKNLLANLENLLGRNKN